MRIIQLETPEWADEQEQAIDNLHNALDVFERLGIVDRQRVNTLRDAVAKTDSYEATMLLKRSAAMLSVTSEYDPEHAGLNIYLTLISYVSV